MIRAYLVDTVTIVKYAEEDSWGDPLATSDIDVPAKINYSTRLIHDIRGEEVLSIAMIYMSLDIEGGGYLNRALDHNDRIKFDGIEHVILKIVKPKAFSDPHYEVYVS